MKHPKIKVWKTNENNAWTDLERVLRELVTKVNELSKDKTRSVSK